MAVNPSLDYILCKTSPHDGKYHVYMACLVRSPNTCHLDESSLISAGLIQFWRQGYAQWTERYGPKVSAEQTCRSVTDLGRLTTFQYDRQIRDSAQNTQEVCVPWGIR